MDIAIGGTSVCKYSTSNVLIMSHWARARGGGDPSRIILDLKFESFNPLGARPPRFDRHDPSSCLSLIRFKSCLLGYIPFLMHGAASGVW